MYLTGLLGELGTVCAHEKLPLEQLNTCGEDIFHFLSIGTIILCISAANNWYG
jgi:hypothetical protein